MTDASERLTLAFGYKQGLPEGTRAAWGCRAIAHQDGHVDVVWDRVDAFGPDEARLPLLDYLRVVVEAAPFERASELLSSYEMKTREEREFVLFEDDTVIVKGNTNASAGYLYVCAFRKADVPPPDTEDLDYFLSDEPIRRD